MIQWVINKQKGLALKGDSDNGNSEKKNQGVTGVCDSYFTTSGYWCKGLTQPFPNQVVIGAKTSGENESQTEKQVKMKQSSRLGGKVKANRSDPARTIWQNCIMWHPGMRRCCLVRIGWILGLAFSISHNMRTSCDHVVRNIHYWEEDSVNCGEGHVSAVWVFGCSLIGGVQVDCVLNLGLFG